MRFLLTQSGRGPASVFRLVETALAVNAEMERRGQERYRILIPWNDGERQRKLFLHAFANENEQYPGELLLDERLGRILSLFHNTDMGFAAMIAMWISGWEDAGRQVRDHYNQDVTVSDLHGKLLPIGQPTIALELNESPRFHIGVALSYQITPCRSSQLIDAIANRPVGAFGLGRDLLSAARDVVNEIERNLCRTYNIIPGTFAATEKLMNATLDQDFVPLTSRPFVNTEMAVPASSIYVTTAGKCSSNDPLRAALTWNVPIFTNNPDYLGGGQFAEYSVLKHPNIQFHFTHAHWEAIGMSLQSEKPTLVCKADPLQNPEIYLNNEKLTQWGLAHIYDGQPLERQQSELYALLPKQKLLLKNLQWRFGTLDGGAVAARKIVDELLK